jgi:hypothetical protein
MPITVGFEEPRTFVFTATGDITFADSHRILEELDLHPRLGPGVLFLADARQVTAAPSTVELRKIASELKPILTRTAAPLAIVTESLWMYGLARMFSILAELANTKVHAFRDMREARNWLASHG